MNKFFFIALFIVLKVALSAQQTSSDSFTVYLFLLEDCKITRAYTDKLTAIHSDFSGDSIGIIGLFPNPVSTDSSVAEFSEKHQLPFTCTRRLGYERAVQFRVEVTPEVVVYNETQQKILYQGRIDNLYERVGQRRQVVTSFELEAALNAVRKNKPVPIPRTQAIGCFLPK